MPDTYRKLGNVIGTSIGSHLEKCGIDLHDPLVDDPWVLVFKLIGELQDEIRELKSHQVKPRFQGVELE